MKQTFMHTAMKFTRKTLLDLQISAIEYQYINSSTLIANS